MSYILDALKRAEAERDRGAVPGLHTPPVFVGASGAPRSRSRLMLTILGGGLLVALVWALWRWQNPLPALPTIAVTTTSPTMVPAAPVILSAPTPTPALTPTPRTTVAASVPAAPRPASPTQLAGANMAKPARSEKVSLMPKPLTPPAAVTTGTPVMNISQLPPDISQTLPKLTISGSTYSDNPAYRMVILNGQVFHEGEKPGPDLVLEQITAKAVVFNFKGYRYAMPN